MLKVICILWGGGLCRERLLLEDKGIAQAGRKHFKNKFTEPKGSGAFICGADSAWGPRVGVRKRRLHLWVWLFAVRQPGLPFCVINRDSSSTVDPRGPERLRLNCGSQGPSKIQAQLWTPGTQPDSGSTESPVRIPLPACNLASGENA